MEIRAAVARHANRPFTIERADLEAPRNNEVLVRIHGVGLCHTDLIARSQFIPIPLPAVLGPEGAGTGVAGGWDGRKVRGGGRGGLGVSSGGGWAPWAGELPWYCRRFSAWT